MQEVIDFHASEVIDLHASEGTDLHASDNIKSFEEMKFFYLNVYCCRCLCFYMKIDMQLIKAFLLCLQL